MRIAANITLDYDAKTLTIDGEEFPFYLQAAGPTVTPDPTTDSPLYVVSLPVMAESFTIVGEPPKENPE